MFSKKSIILFSLILLGGLLISSSVYARGLVPCGGDNERPCNVCHIFQLGQNVLKVVANTIVPAAGVLLVIIAGTLMFLGGAKPDMFQKGKQMLQATAIGAAIFYSAWAIVNTLIVFTGQNLTAPGSTFTSNWTNFTCTAPDIDFYQPPPGLHYSCNVSDLCEVNSSCKLGDPNCYDGPACGGKCTGLLTKDTCDNPEILAKEHNEFYPRRNAPELVKLISDIRDKLPGKNLGEESTFDKSSPLCNYTRGDRHCDSSCSHAINSCHYGGKTGNQGALAVDFGNEDIGDEIIKAALQSGAKSARCEDSKGHTVSCGSGSATHVHINSLSCDSN